LREALPPRALPAGVLAVVEVITAVPSLFARSFFVARVPGSGVTEETGVSSSSSSDPDEEDAELAELRATAWMADRFFGKLLSFELDSDDELPDESESELESELEEGAALRTDFFVVGGSLSSLESESELELESELEAGLALRFDMLGS